MDLKLLIVEDSESDAALVVRELLRSGFSITWKRVETVDAVRDALRGSAWDVVVFDSAVPSLGALEALSLAMEAQPGVPFIVVSATLSEEEAMKVMRAGAADFVTKQRFDRLGPAVLRELREPRARAPAQLVPARLLAAQEAERRRIARALHDELGQILTALQLTLRGALESRGPATKQAITEALSLAAHACQQTRDFSQELCPVVLDDFGLAAALSWLAERHRRWHGISIELEVDPVGRFEPPVEVAAFRLVQEALINIARHAEARSVRIVVEELPRELKVEVRDDGRGFDFEAALGRSLAGESMGLAGMRERVSLGGGTWEIEPGPDGGSVVRARFPIVREVAR